MDDLFGDDFGGGGGGGAGLVPAAAAAPAADQLLAPAATDTADPAADFMMKEQQELGSMGLELEVEQVGGAVVTWRLLSSFLSAAVCWHGDGPCRGGDGGGLHDGGRGPARLGHHHRAARAGDGAAQGGGGGPGTATQTFKLENTVYLDIVYS